MGIEKQIGTRRFQPLWWLRGAHAQTLAGVYWPDRLPEYRAVSRRVALPDGDILIVHDDCPDGWSAGGNIAILTHGLGGSHRSPLLVRLVAKLTARGVRVFRWDMRGCGAGIGLAGRPYHAGCSDDLRHVIASVLQLCSIDHSTSLSPLMPRITLFGVSLSGNVVLKYLGESPESVPQQITQAICINPPIDLAASIKTLDRGVNRLYDRHFVGSLTRHLSQRLRLNPQSPMPTVKKAPQRLFDFDNWYTAPMSGFPSAEVYYERCSAAQFIPRIKTPTTIITSRNDPMIPVEIFSKDRIRFPTEVKLVVEDDGGHVGYIAKPGLDPDVYWLDWRVVELIC